MELVAPSSLPNVAITEPPSWVYTALVAVCAWAALGCEPGLVSTTKSAKPKIKAASIATHVTLLRAVLLNIRAASSIWRAGLVNPAVLYNATTVAIIGCQAHLPGGGYLKHIYRTSENAVNAKFSRPGPMGGDSRVVAPLQVATACYTMKQRTLPGGGVWTPKRCHHADLARLGAELGGSLATSNFRELYFHALR
jgi:hypothetical protein